MKIEFLTDPTNIDELKVAYRRLAMEHHPDKGGNTETMQQINAEYEYLLRVGLQLAGLTAEEVEAEMVIDAVMREAVAKIMNLGGIVIEIVFKWVWVSGATYSHRRALKEAGFFFAPKKKVWYWRGTEHANYTSRGSMEMDDIKSKYGSFRYDGPRTPSLA